MIFAWVDYNNLVPYNMRSYIFNIRYKFIALQ